MSNKKQFYKDLTEQVQSLIGEESNLIANMANLSAVIYHALADVNWVGFYLIEGDELVLGPFQGQPACIRIPVGKGVCGTCAASGETQLVDDVHAFTGHIACDAASNSELVVPFYRGEQLIGVFDIDSPSIARFDQDDKIGVQVLVNVLEEAVF